MAEILVFVTLKKGLVYLARASSTRIEAGTDIVAMEKIDEPPLKDICEFEEL